jgi:predicted ATPase
MRNDHVFYGHIGRAHPTPDDIEHAMREARRLRAVALHDLLRERFRRVAALFHRRPAAKLRTC